MADVKQAHHITIVFYNKVICSVLSDEAYTLPSVKKIDAIKLWIFKYRENRVFSLFVAAILVFSQFYR